MSYHESAAWVKYKALMEERPSAFRNGMVQLVTDDDAIDKYHEETGKALGVVYEGKHHYMLSELVRDTDREKAGVGNAIYTTERLLPVTKVHRVMMIPLYSSRFLMLEHYNNALRETTIRFPSGYGESRQDAEESLIRKMSDILSIKTISAVDHLGVAEINSGIVGETVHVYSCNITKPTLVKGTGVKNAMLMDEHEILDRVRYGEINDSLSLSALIMYLVTFKTYPLKKGFFL